MTVVIIEGERPSLLPEGPMLEGEVLGPGIAVLRYGLLETVPQDVLAQAEAIIVRPGVQFGREEINCLDCCRVPRGPRCAVGQQRTGNTQRAGLGRPSHRNRLQ